MISIKFTKREKIVTALLSVPFIIIILAFIFPDLFEGNCFLGGGRCGPLFLVVFFAILAAPISLGVLVIFAIAKLIEVIKNRKIKSSPSN